MSELVHVQPSLSEQMDFARVVVTRPEGAARSLLPDTYRDNPANVLIAVGLGSAMGLSFAESLYRIDVIGGKPTAGAELIAANVRKAGHKLRLKVTEDPPSATCTIIRADDPDEPTTVTRDMGWAQKMGLDRKDNYLKQPATMLSWRAISACARLACPEALYGVAYTPDEMREAAPVQSSGGGLAAALSMPADPTPDPEPDPHAPGPDDVPLPDVPEPITAPQLKKLHTVLTNLQMSRDEALPFYASVIGHDVESSKALTKDEAGAVIDALEAVEEGREPAPVAP